MSSHPRNPTSFMRSIGEQSREAYAAHAAVQLIIVAWTNCCFMASQIEAVTFKVVDGNLDLGSGGSYNACDNTTTTLSITRE